MTLKEIQNRLKNLKAKGFVQSRRRGPMYGCNISTSKRTIEPGVIGFLIHQGNWFSQN